MTILDLRALSSLERDDYSIEHLVVVFSGDPLRAVLPGAPHHVGVGRRVLGDHVVQQVTAQAKHILAARTLKQKNTESWHVATVNVKILIFSKFLTIDISDI